MSKILIREFGTFRVSKVLRVSRIATNLRTFRKTRVFRVSRLVNLVSTYKYKRLPNEESIRVLALDPGKDGDQLTGTLKFVHLHRPTATCDSRHETHLPEAGVTRWTPDCSYEAISYVWGSDVKDHVILLSGKAHQITANLSDALHQCRLPEQSRALWADSICIDQAKVKEKNHQVYLMGRIYASSQRTLICLGTDRNNRDHARNAFGVISDTNRMMQEVFQSPDFSWELGCFPWPLPDSPLVNDSRWQSRDTLFRHPWFSRGWVVQEAALGRETSIFWAGCKSTLLDVMRADTWYLRRVDSLTAKRPDNIVGPALLQHTIMNRQLAEFNVFYPNESWIQEQDILFALHFARPLGLHDPRDRIFAFMALPFVWNPVPVLRPHYEQSHLELYQSFIMKYLEETSDLNILSYVSDESYAVSLDGALCSSWVPRWDHPHWQLDTPGSYLNGLNFGRTSAKSVDFAISPGVNGAPASLKVRAVIFNSIRLVTPRFQDSTTIEGLITIWTHLSERAGPIMNYRQDQTGFSHESLKFLVTLAHGLWGGSSEEEWAEALKLYSRFLTNIAEFSASSSGSEISLDIKACHGHLMNLAKGLRLFSLQRGYYGQGPQVIKEEDVCAFVFGVRSPIILRQIPEAGARHYKVIGSAFVVSKGLNNLGVPLGLHQWDIWEDWDRLCEFEGWTDWGLKEEQVILI